MSYKEAVNKLFEETPTDYILGYHETLDYFQFYVNCGGDACTYRIYKDGRIYER